MRLLILGTGGMATKVMAARIAVARRRGSLIGRAIFEQFQRRPLRKTQHPQARDRRARMHAQMRLHPVVVRRPRQTHTNHGRRGGGWRVIDRTRWVRRWGRLSALDFSCWVRVDPE